MFTRPYVVPWVVVSLFFLNFFILLWRYPWTWYNNACACWNTWFQIIYEHRIYLWNKIIYKRIVFGIRHIHVYMRIICLFNICTCAIYVVVYDVYTHVLRVVTINRVNYSLGAKKRMYTYKVIHRIGLCCCNRARVWLLDACDFILCYVLRYALESNYNNTCVK